MQVKHGRDDRADKHRGSAEPPFSNRHPTRKQRKFHTVYSVIFLQYIRISYGWNISRSDTDFVVNFFKSRQRMAVIIRGMFSERVNHPLEALDGKGLLRLGIVPWSLFRIFVSPQQTFYTKGLRQLLLLQQKLPSDRHLQKQEKNKKCRHIHN